MKFGATGISKIMFGVNGIAKACVGPNEVFNYTDSEWDGYPDSPSAIELFTYKLIQDISGDKYLVATDTVEMIVRSSTSLRAINFTAVINAYKLIDGVWTLATYDTTTYDIGTIEQANYVIYNGVWTGSIYEKTTVFFPYN